MNTENFIKKHDGLLESIGETCTLLTDGTVCRDGIKCDIEVIGYEGAEEFASSNSVFLIEDFFRMIRNLPGNLKWQDISLRLCVKNVGMNNKPSWKGEILYKECLPVNFAEDWFNKNLGKDGDGERDGFLVFNKHEILKEDYIPADRPTSDRWMDDGTCKGDGRKCDSDCDCQKGRDDQHLPDPEPDCDCQKGCDDPNCLCTNPEKDDEGWENAEGMSLHDFVDEFKKSLVEGIDGGNFVKRFFFTDDGNGTITAKSDVNGVKKAKTFFYAV